MPELPEVETIANGLNKRVAGDRIDSVWVGSKPEPLKSSAAEISDALEGAKVERVRRVGKHIVFDLSAGKTASGSQWIVHLGMTGKMLVATPETETPKHTHLLQDGSCDSLIRDASDDWKSGRQVSAGQGPSR